MDGRAADARLAPGRLPLTAGAAALALYLAFPAARYNFDGVACAIAVDLGDLKHLVHGNHLGYGILGYWWFSLWQALGYAGPALYALQVLSSLLGAATVAAVCALLLDLGVAPGLALAAAMGCGVSEYFWTWSLESQVYPLGALFLALCAREAVRESPRPVRLGLLLTGAALGHVGHAMFAPALAWRLRREPRRLALAALASALSFAAAYALAARFCVRPSSAEEVRVWLLGSAALTLDKRFFWHGGWTPANLAGWLAASVRMWGGGALGAAFGWGLAAFGARGAEPGPKRRAARVFVAGLAGYALLFLSWEPRTPVYRVSDFVLLWPLIALGLDSLPNSPRAKTAFLAAAVAALGLTNLVRTVIPGSDPANNAALQTVRRLTPSWPEKAWVIAGDQYTVYIPYFAHRAVIDPRYFNGAPEALAERIKTLTGAGDPVFALPAALTPEWRERLSALPRQELAGGELWAFTGR